MRCVRGISRLGLAAALFACSPPYGQPPTSGVAAAEAVHSASDYYRLLNMLPKAGQGSLAAFYQQLSAMTFQRYFQDQIAVAPDVTIRLDGRTVANPRDAMLQHKRLFAAADAAYGTIGAWWRLTGGAPTAPGSEAAYQALLAQRFQGDESLALVGGCSADSGLNYQQLAQMMLVGWTGVQLGEHLLVDHGATADAEPTSLVQPGSSTGSAGGSGQEAVPVGLRQRLGLPPRRPRATQASAASSAQATAASAESSRDATGASSSEDNREAQEAHDPLDPSMHTGRFTRVLTRGEDDDSDLDEGAYDEQLKQAGDALVCLREQNL